MRWKNIRAALLILLVVLNLFLGAVQLTFYEEERKEEKEEMSAALSLCQEYGIETSGIDFVCLDESYDYFVLGESELHSFTTEGKMPVREQLSLSVAEKVLKEHFPETEFSFMEQENTWTGWSFMFCRTEESVLYLDDSLQMEVSRSGSVSVFYTSNEAVEEEEQTMQYSAGRLLAQSLLRLKSLELDAVKLRNVFIAYKTEKEDRKSYSVPYAVFVYELENGSEYQIFIRTGER